MNALRHLAIILALLPIVSVSCRRDTAAVPRPEAWPRVAEYDTVYAPVAGLPVIFGANARAGVTVRHPEAGVSHADIRYDDYRATLHLTVVRASGARLDSIVANRLQRMAINLGDFYAERSSVVSADGSFITTILTSRPDCPSPVQFLSADSAGAVCGSLFFDSPVEKPDSLMPAVATVERDVVHAVTNLTRP